MTKILDRGQPVLKEFKKTNLAAEVKKRSVRASYLAFAVRWCSNPNALKNFLGNLAVYHEIAGVAKFQKDSTRLIKCIYLIHYK